MPQLKSRLLVVTDRQQTNGRPLLSVLKLLLKAGSPAVQLRERDLSARDLLSLAHDVRTLTEASGSQFVVNDRLDVAMTMSNVGVHLRSNSLPVSMSRRLLGSGRLLGVSAHSFEEALRAESDGADYIVLGPIYSTPSKRPFGPPIGLPRLEEVCRRVRIPVLAIGGVTATRAAEVRGAGAFGAAVIAAVFCAPDVEAAARELLAALSSST
jgi:thiamine-phosphate pyrophosphorylase